METCWIEAVVRINSAIVEAEACITTQASELLTMAQEGKDTAQVEWLLVSYTHSLVLLRAAQTLLLQEPDCEG